jgi:uncharacterized protein (DUF2249 family)
MTLEFKELDVRPMLKAGVEPFQQIMSAVDGLDSGQGLRLLAPFKPAPLFSVMERKGFRYDVSELGGGDYEVRFYPESATITGSDDADTADNWPEPARRARDPAARRSPVRRAGARTLVSLPGIDEARMPVGRQLRPDRRRFPHDDQARPEIRRRLIRERSQTNTG